jgi:2-dehydropantoate 2-reductase
MRIAIMGSGGVGAYVGARLQAAGEDVAFIARGAHLAALREDGLHIQSPLHPVHLAQVNATDTPADIGPVDLVVFAVKLWDTETAAQAMAPLIGPETRVLTLQNGIDSAAMIARQAPQAQVRAGVIYVSAVIDRPGVIRSPGGLHVIVADGAHGDPVMAEFAAACARAQALDAKLTDTVDTVLWEKFIALSALSATTSLLRASMGQILANPEARILQRQLIEEGVAVGRQLGKVTRDDLADEIMAKLSAMPYAFRSSMSEDLERNKPLELRWLSGRMHHLGVEHGVATPGHSAVYRGLVLYEHGKPADTTKTVSTPTTTIATHSGSFHADDVFGVGVLMGVFPSHTLLRTRKQELIDAADFAVDVGGSWDAATGRFDHHQRGFDGARPAQTVDGQTVPGVGYASAGLVWAAHGSAFVTAWASAQGQALDEPAVQEVVRSIDHSLVQYLDIVDTGQGDVSPGIFGLSSLIAQLNTHWMEEAGMDNATKAALQETRFREAIAITRKFLDHAISKKVGQIRSVQTVRNAPRLLGGRVLHLTEGGMPWTRVVVDEMPEVMFVIYPDSDGDQYQVKTVPVEPGSFTARLDLPKSWSGLRDQELAAVTGVQDSVFCHLNLFIGGARSFEGAVRLAELALATPES